MTGPLLRGTTAVRRFVRESNLIEGIDREPTDVEYEAHHWFLSLNLVTLIDLKEFVQAVAAAPLRCRPGQNVRVGSHVPPAGGPDVRFELIGLLEFVYTASLSPYEVHQRYERLHPFMDGNGRSGRVLWAWQMQREGRDPFALPFLHRWYYQSLDAARSAS